MHRPVVGVLVRYLPYYHSTYIYYTHTHPRNDADLYFPGDQFSLPFTHTAVPVSVRYRGHRILNTAKMFQQNIFKKKTV
jgi:hypothetical protein